MCDVLSVRRVNRAVRLCVLTLVTVVMISGSSFAAKRVALVIGNSKYDDAPLRNPSQDADDVASTLTSLGFQVTKLKDVPKVQFEAAVDDVVDKLSEGDVCLIFYAGHGMELENRNYLVPVGATIDRPQHVKQRCVTVDYLLDALEFSGCSLKVVVIDACRNNPFRGFSRSRGGLAELSEAPEGTIVSFSTSPKTTALDGNGANSPFARNLVKTLRAHADSYHIVDLFLETSRAVRNETGQRPFLRLDASMPRYFLKPATPEPAEPATVNVPQKKAPLMQSQSVGKEPQQSVPAKKSSSGNSSSRSESLLANLNPVQHAVTGTWRQERGQLISPSVPFAQMVIPTDSSFSPESYQLKISFQRQTSTGSFVVGLPVKDGQVVLEFSDQGLELLEVSGRVETLADLPRPRGLLSSEDLMITVNSDNVLVTGKSLFKNFTVHAAHPKPPRSWELREPQLFLGSPTVASFRITELKQWID